ncbi:hypothetical protein F8M41_000045 [Gigaspora margarita]|uniref:Uncharacterized protein n=1 Tax=Gigaspora margarita TaxID=4874 RepID=A0A8H4B5I1_GIGMA|nr:hypothetical protein F8M41_000045 [Gigaspora margarita]
MKKLYENDQNKKTIRAKGSLTLASDNTGAHDQDMISKMIDQDQNTTTNPNIKILVVEVQVPKQENSHAENVPTKKAEKMEESQYIDHIQLYKFADYNQETQK